MGIYGFHIFGTDASGYAPFSYPPEVSVAEKIIFVSPRNSDKATLTVSSQVASLPITNIQNQEPHKVWRSEGIIEEVIDFRFPAVVAVNVAALTWPQDSLSSSAMARLIGYSVLADMGTYPDLGDPAADSGWQSLWPGSVKHSDPDWGPEVGLIRLTNSNAYRYWRLVITDPDCPNDYLDIGRIALDRAIQFKINPRYDGGLGFVAIDIQEANGYGQIFTDPRPYQQRQMELTWTALGELDVMQDAMELSRLRGQAGDLHVFLSPSATTEFHRKSMQALFEGPQRYTPAPMHVNDKDGAARKGWGFTLNLIQKL